MKPYSLSLRKLMSLFWILAYSINSEAATKSNVTENDFKEVTNCVSSKVISGDTCSNVVVEIDFSNCDPSLANTQPQRSRVVCKGKSITARAAAGEFRGQSQYNKVEDGWGSVKWIPVGSPKSYRNAHSAAPEPSPKKEALTSSKAPESAVNVERTPAADPATPESTSPVKTTVTGFLDMRYTGYRSADASINEKTRSGFLLDDGALYFSVKKDDLEAAIDLPFSRNGLITSDTSDLSISKTKAQIYGRYHFSKTMHVTFGQFDTVYGFELNDSKDRSFGNVGLAYSQTLPVVHTGTYLTYAENGFTLRALVANPSDKQTFGTDPADSSTEYGGIAGYSNDFARVQIGFLTRAVADLSSGQSNRVLVDSLLGFSFGQFDLDFQYSTVTNPRKNTLTDVATDKEDPGSVAMAILTYKPTEKLKISGRFEVLDSDPAGTNYPKAQSFALVGNYAVQDGLTVRLEWNDIHVERSTSAAVYDESRWDISGVVTF